VGRIWGAGWAFLGLAGWELVSPFFLFFKTVFCFFSLVALKPF
jgi:hypothetical protein